MDDIYQELENRFGATRNWFAEIRDGGYSPSPELAQHLLRHVFFTDLFPRLDHPIRLRIAEQFASWNQQLPDIVVARNDWGILRRCLHEAGRLLPLVAVGQVMYGHGAGHPYFGLHRGGKFHGEEKHTYVYHATSGRVLKDGQAADYFRIDRVPRKPTLYAFWLMTAAATHRAAEEAHQRWSEYRYREHDDYQFDCASFVTDLAKHVASVGLGDFHNPFTYAIPSHTIRRGRPEERGVRAILRNSHRPPAALLMMLDPATYDRLAACGRHGEGGWVIDGDHDFFNITSQ